MTTRSIDWLKSEFLTHDPYDYNIDLIDTLFPIGHVGATFFVDPVNGDDDSYDGRSADKAFATLQTGHDACTANAGDVIVRMRGTETVTSSITITTGGITIIGATYGLNPLAQGEYFATLADAAFTNGPVITITARCAIAGLGWVSRDTGATFYGGAAMLIGGEATASPFGVHILGNRFPKWNVSNRIGIAIEGSSDCLVELCSFEGVGAAFASGIYVQGATQNLEIRGNRFRDCTYGITHGAFTGGAGGPHCLYTGNFCEDSKLLETGSNTATGLIAGNYLETATDAASYDVTVATAQALGLNFSGNHYSE